MRRTQETVLTWEKFFPAWLYPENEPFVQQSMAGLQAAGLKPDMRAYRFCTNAAYSAGLAGVPDHRLRARGRT